LGGTASIIAGGEGFTEVGMNPMVKKKIKQGQDNKRVLHRPSLNADRSYGDIVRLLTLLGLAWLLIVTKRGHCVAAISIRRNGIRDGVDTANSDKRFVRGDDVIGQEVRGILTACGAAPVYPRLQGLDCADGTNGGGMRIPCLRTEENACNAEERSRAT